MCREAYGAASPQALAKLDRDWTPLIAFYDFPERWCHLRITNLSRRLCVLFPLPLSLRATRRAAGDPSLGVESRDRPSRGPVSPGMLDELLDTLPRSPGGSSTGLDPVTRSVRSSPTRPVHPSPAVVLPRPRAPGHGGTSHPKADPPAARDWWVAASCRDRRLGLRFALTFSVPSLRLV